MLVLPDGLEQLLRLDLFFHDKGSAKRCFDGEKPGWE